MATDKALQYVGPIMDAYNAAEKAGATALGHALGGRSGASRTCPKSQNAKCKSIRAALAHLSTLDENLNQKPATTTTGTRKRGSGSSATGLAPPEPDTPSAGLKAELENAGADEIIVNIESDADKLEEVAKASIAKLTPDKVCEALIAVWDEKDISELCNRLDAHFGRSKPTSDVSSTRRLVAQQHAN